MKVFGSPGTPAPGKTGPRSPVIRDLIIIAVLAVIVWCVAAWFDVFEQVLLFTWSHESWEIDELIIVSLFLVGAFFVFSYRRLREFRNEYTELARTKEALTRTNRQLGLLTSLTRHDSLNRISVALGYVKLIGKYSTEPRVKEMGVKAEKAIIALREQIEFTRDYQQIGGSAPKWQDPAALFARLNSFPLFQRIELSGVGIFADPLLEKVFFNLLENTVRHGEHAETVRVHDRKESGRYILIYEDDGVGVPDNEKCRIFDQGYGSHTGYGLFLVREILAITGISIRETGIPGKGARFEIAVPEGAYRNVVAAPE
ncbi:MAG: HAMP domain-containing sensor histidine kinase [Methanoregula sp.]|jgi:signal transduction histidine kinase